MKLALLSDTHGHLGRTRVACEALAKVAPDLVLHGGDIGKLGVLEIMEEVFVEKGLTVRAVVGNVDEHRPEIRDYNGAQVTVSQTCRLDLEGTRIGLIHGHERGLLKEWIEGGEFDVVVTGHTHRRADSVTRDTRVVNPGAVYRTKEPSCATLDLKSGELVFIDLDFG